MATIYMMIGCLRSDGGPARNLIWRGTRQNCSPAVGVLNEWYAERLPLAARGRDPLLNVISEGGPFQVRGQLTDYLKRLRATGRGPTDALEPNSQS